MNKILLKKNRVQQNENFLHYSSISKTTKVIIAIVVLLCSSFIVFSFFIEFKYGGELTIITPQEIASNNIKFTTRVLQPLGYLIAGIGVPIVSCCLQSTTRNKLAEPTTLGFFPVILMAIMVSSVNPFGSNIYFQWIFACCFSSIIIFMNLILTKKDISKSTMKSVLIGFTFNGIITGINWILYTYLPSLTSSINPLVWLAGTNLVPLTSTNVIISGVVCLVFTIALLIMIPYYNVIQKDPILAKSLGINVNTVYWITAFFSIFIVVGASFVAGGVMLLGLVIPHLIRMIFRTDDNTVVMTVSPFLGSALLLASNILRNGYNLNMNLLTAILAIPVFIILLTRKNHHDKA